MTSPMSEPPSADAGARFAAYLADLAAHVDDPECGEDCREILNEDPETQRAWFELSEAMTAGTASTLPLSVLVTALATVVCAAALARPAVGPRRPATGHVPGRGGHMSRNNDRRRPEGRGLRWRTAMVVRLRERWRAGRLARLREDRGSATAWAIGVVVVVALLSGAVLDGGNAMAARVQALDVAQQAARAGANQLDLAALRNDGLVRLNPAAAQAAAEQFLRQSGVSGAATATPTQVSVTVTRAQPTLLLDAIGVASISMTATATAVPATTA